MKYVTPGDWFVARRDGYGDTHFEAARAVAVRPKTIEATCKGWSRPFRYSRDAVVAVVRTEDEANRLIQIANGYKGERDRRIRAAQDAYHAATDKLFSSAIYGPPVQADGRPETPEARESVSV